MRSVAPARAARALVSFAAAAVAAMGSLGLMAAVVVRGVSYGPGLTDWVLAVTAAVALFGVFQLARFAWGQWKGAPGPGSA